MQFLKKIIFHQSTVKEVFRFFKFPYTVKINILLFDDTLEHIWHAMDSMTESGFQNINPLNILQTELRKQVHRMPTVREMTTSWRLLFIAKTAKICVCLPG